MTRLSEIAHVPTVPDWPRRPALAPLISVAKLMKPFCESETLSKNYQQHNIWVVHRVIHTTSWALALDSAPPPAEYLPSQGQPSRQSGTISTSRILMVREGSLDVTRTQLMV